MNPITRLDALRIAEAAFAEADARGAAGISVAVTDAGGHVRAAVRGDGQGLFGLDIATAKAVSALGMGRDTLALSALLPPQTAAAVSAATGGRFLAIGGGVIVRDASGAVAGAAGVSGGLPETDHAIILAALAACGFPAAP